MEIVPLLYFTILFLHKWKRNHAFNVGSAILSVYILSSLFGVIMRYSGGDYGVINVEWSVNHVIDTIAYCGLLSIVIMPFYHMRSESIIKSDLFSQNQLKAFRIIGWFFIIVCVANILLSLPDIIIAFSTGNFGDIRNEYYADSMNTEVNTSGSQSWYMYFINIVPQFSPVILLWFFFSVINCNESIVFNFLLLLSSLSLFAISILTAARTQLIYWLLTYYILYVFFRPQIKQSSKKIFKILFISFASLAVLYVIIITISRFGDGQDMVDSLLFYAGQSFAKFCELSDKYTFDHPIFNRVFPMTMQYVFHDPFNLTDFRMSVSSRIGMHIGVFYTFLGDAMVDFGRIGMVLYVLVLSGISNRIVRLPQNKINTFSHLLLFILIVRMPLLGVFAYVYYGVNTSFLIIGTCILSFYFNNTH